MSDRACFESLLIINLMDQIDHLYSRIWHDRATMISWRSRGIFLRMTSTSFFQYDSLNWYDSSNDAGLQPSSVMFKMSDHLTAVELFVRSVSHSTYSVYASFLKKLKRLQEIPWASIHLWIFTLLFELLTHPTDEQAHDSYVTIE